MVKMSNLRARVMPATYRRTMIDPPSSSPIVGIRFWANVRRSLKNCPMGIGVPLIQRTASGQQVNAIGRMIGLRDSDEDFVAHNRPVILVRIVEPPQSRLPKPHF